MHVRRNLVFLAISLILVLAFASPMAQMPTYTKVKYLRPMGDKSKQVPVRLIFDDERLTIQNKKNGQAMFEMPYKQIDGFTYSKSKHPRWKTGAGAAVAVGVFAIPIFFMKGKKHWLTIKHGEDMRAFQLHKSAHRMIVAELEAKTGKKAERIVDE